MQLLSHLQWWSKYSTHRWHRLQWNDLWLMQVLHKLQKYLCFYGEKVDVDGCFICYKCWSWIESVGDIDVVIYQK
jgi:hypothetical protein